MDIMKSTVIKWGNFLKKYLFKSFMDSCRQKKVMVLNKDGWLFLVFLVLPL